MTAAISARALWTARLGVLTEETTAGDVTSLRSTASITLSGVEDCTAGEQASFRKIFSKGELVEVVTAGDEASLRRIANIGLLTVLTTAGEVASLRRTASMGDEVVETTAGVV